MESITDFFISLLDTHRSTDIANDAFRKHLAENPDLRREYSEWCHQVGSSEKHGFLDFCEEYLDMQDSKYDSLSDYDDDL